MPPPARSCGHLGRNASLPALARALALLLLTSCVVNISFLGRHLGVLHQGQQQQQQQQSPRARPPPPGRPQPQRKLGPGAARKPANVSGPVVFVDDAFSAEDASYSESGDEEEDEESEEEEVEEGNEADLREDEQVRRPKTGGRDAMGEESGEEYTAESRHRRRHKGQKRRGPVRTAADERNELEGDGSADDNEDDDEDEEEEDDDDSNKNNRDDDEKANELDDKQKVSEERRNEQGEENTDAGNDPSEDVGDEENEEGEDDDDRDEEVVDADDKEAGAREFKLLDLLASNFTAIADKHHIFSLLLDAGLEKLSLETIYQLPKWSQVSALYYKSNRGPVIYGLDTCDMYRRTVAYEDRYLGPAGLFNTGTNALWFLLRENVIMNKKAQWQVPWGKHRLERIRLNHSAPNMEQLNKKHVLPIVIIKDVYTWLQSMCKSPYEARWRHRSEHCPNLIPNNFDFEHFPALRGHKTVPVKVLFSENQTIYWDSLVSLYNEWYKLYLEAKYPRLMVRFEDLLFAPEELLQAIADCVGGDLAPKIVYNTESAKEHGSQTNLVGAVIKTGTGQGRLNNMTKDDLDYVRDALDKDLLAAFDYTISDVQMSLLNQASLEAD